MLEINIYKWDVSPINPMISSQPVLYILAVWYCTNSPSHSWYISESCGGTCNCSTSLNTGNSSDSIWICSYIWASESQEEYLVEWALQYYVQSYVREWGEGHARVCTHAHTHVVRRTYTHTHTTTPIPTHAHLVPLLEWLSSLSEDHQTCIDMYTTRACWEHTWDKVWYWGVTMTMSGLVLIPHTHTHIHTYLTNSGWVPKKSTLHSC